MSAAAPAVRHPWMLSPSGGAVTRVTSSRSGPMIHPLHCRGPYWEADARAVVNE
jgi:hypothetical protein